jgi:conjugative relaxase-like TrwC/TraI family protein
MNLKNAKSYFSEHLSIGDYYGEKARVQGEWFGQGATRLGLTGPVAADEFLALCENEHPRTGGLLTQRRDRLRRVFYDFTFSPPKSVSVAALVAADKRIVAAHAKAVKTALSELELRERSFAWGKTQFRSADRKLRGRVVSA